MPNIFLAPALLIGIAVLWFVWWPFPLRIAKRKMIRDPKQRADIEDAYRKTISQAIGGAALLTGIYFTVQQYYLATRTQNLEQYQKGFDALKGSDVAVHIGGIYGLEILSRSVPEWRTSILMGLSASAVVFSLAKKDATATKIPPDAEAALIVVARSGEDSGERTFPLAGGSFHGSRIPG